MSDSAAPIGSGGSGEKTQHNLGGGATYSYLCNCWAGIGWAGLADPLDSDSLVQKLGCYNQHPESYLTDTLLDAMDENESVSNRKQSSLRRLTVFSVEDSPSKKADPELSYPVKKVRKLK